MLKVMLRKTFKSLTHGNMALAQENVILQRQLDKLRKKFAAQILYGDTAPKNPVDAALEAAENMGKKDA